MVKATLPVDVEPWRWTRELRGVGRGDIHRSKKGLTVHVQKEGLVRRPRPEVADKAAFVFEVEGAARPG